MDVDALRDAIAQLTPESSLEQCLEVETGIEHVTDPKVKEELMALYEKQNEVLEGAAGGEEEEEEEEEDNKEVDLAEEGEDGFNHDQYASVTERVMGFQAWCAPRRQERNRRLDAMMAIASVPGHPSEEEFLKIRAKLDAERAERKRARESGGAAAAAPAE